MRLIHTLLFIISDDHTPYILRTSSVGGGGALQDFLFLF